MLAISCTGETWPDANAVGEKFPRDNSLSSTAISVETAWIIAGFEARRVYTRIYMLKIFSFKSLSLSFRMKNNPNFFSNFQIVRR